MKAILISDHAKWCALMMNGDKTIEVRKNKGLHKAIQSIIDENGYADIYVYCSKDKSDKETLKLMRGKYGCMKNNDPYGKVIFKFRCYKVEEIEYEYTYETYTLIEEELCTKSCLTKQELHKYLFYKTGYAIPISDLEIFDRPKELWEFEKAGNYENPTIKCKKKEQGRCNYGKSPFTGQWIGCEKARLTKAPQNMVSIEVEG